MLSYHFLLDLAIILLSTKLFGLITRKIHMPQVVGALTAGLILGPAFTGIISETEFINQMAELGVIVLMFNAGIETNVSELKKCGKASLVIAFCGVVIPLAAGFIIAAVYNNNGGILQMNKQELLENIFIGIILTATSVSITVETLRELGRLNSRSGIAILGAAVIDDIIGIIALTIITSSADHTVSLSTVMLKVVSFFVFSMVIGIPFYYLFNKYSKMYVEKRRFVIIAFSFCLIMSFIAEHFFSVASITGAFFAGLVISKTTHAHYISRRFEIISYMLLSPIFFASIGISVTTGSIDKNMMIFSVSLLLAAIITKIIGCGFGALICRYTRAEALQIGVGMVSRGEVALIVATKGATMGLMKTVFFTPVIIIVVVTTIITPVLLKFVYSKNKPK